MAARKQKPKCNTPGCKNSAHSRWKCTTCLAEVDRLIATRKTTEQELVAAGLLEPRKKSGRPRANRVLAALKGKSVA